MTGKERFWYRGAFQSLDDNLLQRFSRSRHSPEHGLPPASTPGCYPDICVVCISHLVISGRRPDLRVHVNRLNLDLSFDRVMQDVVAGTGDAQDRVTILNI